MKAKKKSTSKDIDFMTSAERGRLLDPYRIIPLIPIQPGHNVGDIGCGPGVFSIPLAKYLFSGKLYAVDIHEPMLKEITSTLDSINLNNIELNLSTENSIPIDNNVLDGVFVSCTLEEAQSPSVLLTEIKRIIKQFGWLTIISCLTKNNDNINLEYEYIPKTKLNRMVEKLGFKLLSQRELNDQYYLSVYKCQ